MQRSMQADGQGMPAAEPPVGSSDVTQVDANEIPVGVGLVQQFRTACRD